MGGGNTKPVLKENQEYIINGKAYKVTGIDQMDATRGVKFTLNVENNESIEQKQSLKDTIKKEEEKEREVVIAISEKQEEEAKLIERKEELKKRKMK